MVLVKRLKLNIGSATAKKEEPVTNAELSLISRKLRRHEFRVRKEKAKESDRKVAYDRMSSMKMIFLILVFLLGGKFMEINQVVFGVFVVCELSRVDVFILFCLSYFVRGPSSTS